MGPLTHSRAGNTYCQPHSRAAFGYLRSARKADRPRRGPQPNLAHARLLPSQMVLQKRYHCGRQCRKTVFVPLPDRTVTCFIWKSTSFTRSLTASKMRRPLP